jgi:hypothetical protein
MSVVLDGNFIASSYDNWVYSLSLWERVRVRV